LKRLHKTVQAFLCALSIGAVLIIGAASNAHAQSWYNAAWPYRQEITIDSDNAAFGLSANVSGFPYLVRLTNGSNDLFANAQADGDDILFTASDGVTKLAHEIEAYNGTNNLTAWVRLPTFYAAANTIIYMYYGNPNAVNQENAVGLWGADYASVWHLQEDGASAQYLDSSGNGNAGTGGTITTSNAPTRTSDAVAGYAQDFPNADDRILTGAWGVQGQGLTLSGWYKRDVDSADDDRIISKATSTDPQDHQFLLGINGPSQLRMRLKTGTDPLLNTTTLEGGTVDLDVWTYAAAKYDGTMMYLYKNGDVVTSTPKTGNMYYDTTTTVALGNNPNGLRSFYGKLDELRVENVSRSDGWIKTQYLMQRTSVQGAPASPGIIDTSKFIKMKGWQECYYQYRKLITINRNKVVGTHMNFPVLVRVTLNPVRVQSPYGYDIIFRDENGQPLDHEVESWNDSTGDLVAWVKIPSLSSIADTKLYVYYGNSGVTSPTANPTGVWDSNYKGVWHLADGDGMSGSVTWSGELLTNPGFETGNLTGWTNGGGGSANVGLGCPWCDDNPHSGSYQVYWNSPNLAYSLYQNVSLSGYSSQIDAGNALINATGWFISNEYQAFPPFDVFWMQVRFYDGSSNELAEYRYDTGTLNVSTWAQYGLTEYPVPAGTRSVQIRFNIYEYDGATYYDAGSADDFSVKIGIKQPRGYAQDSTSNQHDGTDYGSTDTAGKIGSARAFAGGAGNEGIVVPDHSDFDFAATNSVTLSAWVNMSSLPAAWRGIVTKSAAGSWYGLWTSDTNEWDFAVYNGAVMIDLYGGGAATGWHHITAVQEGSGAGNTRRIYVDGVQADSAGTAYGVSNAASFIIGDSVIDPDFQGSIDEVRFLKTARSAGWIATEYNNQNDTTTGSDKFIRSVGPEEAASWWNSSWQYKKKLTLNADMIVGTDTIPTRDDSDLADMPVLVSYTDTDIGASAQYSGYDIVFAQGATKLDHELVSFDKNTGKLLAWVRVPALSSSVDTKIDIYYGNGSTGNQENLNGTWSNGFVGVWHLEENGAGVSAAYEDSSPAGHDGTSGTVTITGVPSVGAGKIGNAQNFDGVDDFIYTSNSFANPQNFSISAWLRSGTASGKKIIGLENDQTGTASGNWDRHLYLGTDGDLYFGCYNDSAISTDTVSAVGTYNDNSWHHVVGVRNDGSNTLSIYVDGTIADSMVNAVAETYTGYWRIGSYKLGSGSWPAGADGYFPGTIDEVRVSQKAFSADWVRAEYVNQNSPTSYLTFALPPTVWTWTGTGGTNWSSAGNWDQATYPNSGTEWVAVPSTANKPQLSENISIERLTVQSGASLNLGGHSLSIADVNGLENQGTIVFSGGAVDSINRTDTDSGIVTYTTTNTTIRDSR